MDNIEKEKEVARLLQGRRVESIRKPTDRSFVLVYSSEDVTNGFHCLPILLPLDQAQEFLSHVAWDQHEDSFRPMVECEERNVGGKLERRVFYLPRGNEIGREALVRPRYYWKNHPSEIEIAEEFRLFWNLLHDKSRNFFLHWDADGGEHEVVRINGKHVEVQLRFLIDFLRAKQMHLGIQYEGNYWSRQSLETLGVKSGKVEKTGENFRLWFSVSGDIPSDDCESMSRLLGKVIIPCPGPVEYKSPYDDDEPSLPFIVGQDANGQPVTDTWDEKGKGQDNALTRVFFHREVLGKYYAEPEKYEVKDGHLWCSGAWDLRMDNDHPKHVVVWLKDLGQSLPKQEAEHWRGHNKIPDGDVSRTFRTRNIRGWFADPEMPDLTLKHLYPRVNKIWTERYRWPLWLEPEFEDRYVFRQAHLCLSENQSEFDHQNALLAKLVIDFLNVQEITNALKIETPPNGGLNRLELFLEEAGFAEAKQKIKALRVIQSLRSEGAAHTKGKNYANTLKRANLEGLSKVESSMKIFDGAAMFVEWLLRTVLQVVDNGPPPIE